MAVKSKGNFHYIKFKGHGLIKFSRTKIIKFYFFIPYEFWKWIRNTELKRIYFYFIFFIEFTAVDFLGKYYVVSNCKCGEESSQIHGKDKYTETLIQKLSSWRWRVAYLTLFGMIAQIIHRNCISFALVCMTTDVRENTSVAHSHEERDELSKYRVSTPRLYMEK